MKKIFWIIIAFFMVSLNCYADETENITLLTKQGFFAKPHNSSPFVTPFEEVKRNMLLHLRYSNCYELDKLKALYADNYVNADGLTKDIYFDLIKKTWDSYPDIKYRMDIKNIEINENIAAVQVSESAFATTDSKSGVVDQKGTLENVSDSVYYLEKINNDWVVTSDRVLFEKTFLKYGSAKEMDIKLVAPSQIPANKDYTAILKIDAPKDSLIIASIGQEKITYPQTVAEEVFRKLPESGILERVFKSNDKNINEYAIASFGVTKAEIKNGKEIKVYITGLGFAMSRVNVVPKNEFIKTEKSEKIKDENVKDEKAE